MGALSGVRVVEMAAIGPVPFCGMMLSDLGAEVIRVDRPDAVTTGPIYEAGLIMERGRRSIVVDLKQQEGAEVVLDLVSTADVLLEGFRPGVMERLGLGPGVCLERQPKLVMGRMTGWGQDGPAAHLAGHDLTYLALAGAVDAIGRAGAAPTTPLNLVGDFGGGAMFLITGVLADLLEAGRSGTGQVIDAAMVEGASYLSTSIFGLMSAGQWTGARGENLFDYGAPFYDVYETSDAQYIAVACVEPVFFARFLEVLGVDPERAPTQYDPQAWPQLRTEFTRALGSRTRAQWAEVFAKVDCCVGPVLSYAEAVEDPQATHRRAHVWVDGVVQPAPTPRFSRTPSAIQGAAPRPGQHSVSLLLEAGLELARIDDLLTRGIVEGESVTSG